MQIRQSGDFDLSLSLQERRRPLVLDAAYQNQQGIADARSLQSVATRRSAYHGRYGTVLSVEVDDSESPRDPFSTLFLTEE